MKRALAYCVAAAAVVYTGILLAQGSYFHAAVLVAVMVVGGWTAVVDWRKERGE